jgi:peptidoglycan/xylan/chitin deacetylase (PgdA/CDA1 family)
MSPDERKIYLTFDDGPVPDVTPGLLDVLKEENIRATFFCVGENVEKHPELYSRVLAEGHAVGNHTYNHLNGWKTHGNQYIRNVLKCAACVDSKLFRPPYGRAKKSQMAMLSGQYRIIMWDVLSYDYDKSTSPEQCLRNVSDHVRNGSVIVFHDSLKAQRNMEYTLPRFIRFAKDQGFAFGTL